MTHTLICIRYPVNARCEYNIIYIDTLSTFYFTNLPILYFSNHIGSCNLVV